VTRQEVCARIAGIGIIPAVRVSSPGAADFAAEAVYRAGLPIAEITMTVPSALEVISGLARDFPDMVVGAGTVLDSDTARRCLDAGARFLTGTGLDLGVIELAVKENVAVLPGALTPSEIITAWKAGADFVKVFPCAPLGGDAYIKTLKSALPQIPLVAAGGVKQQTASHFIEAGAAALGVGRELITDEAIRRRKAAWIIELAHRFMSIVKNARSHAAPTENMITFR
jgi:2-dehydro-3-deoxyphosphogluconate aldolase / (4S)-4-hydroxy-2-oxoglutarate aldolase